MPDKDRRNKEAKMASSRHSKQSPPSTSDAPAGSCKPPAAPYHITFRRFCLFIISCLIVCAATALGPACLALPPVPSVAESGAQDAQAGIVSHTTAMLSVANAEAALLAKLVGSAQVTGNADGDTPCEAPVWAQLQYMQVLTPDVVEDCRLASGVAPTRVAAFRLSGGGGATVEWDRARAEEASVPTRQQEQQPPQQHMTLKDNRSVGDDVTLRVVAATGKKSSLFSSAPRAARRTLTLRLRGTALAERLLPARGSSFPRAHPQLLRLFNYQHGGDEQPLLQLSRASTPVSSFDHCMILLDSLSGSAKTLLRDATLLHDRTFVLGCAALPGGTAAVAVVSVVDDTGLLWWRRAVLAGGGLAAASVVAILVWKVQMLMRDVADLVDTMTRISALQLNVGRGHRGEESPFPTIRGIRRQFYALQQQLLSFKSMIPGYLLLSEDRVDAAGRDATRAKETPPPSSGASTAASDSQSSHPRSQDGGRGDDSDNGAAAPARPPSLTPRRPPPSRRLQTARLNTRILHDRVNNFQRQHCTVLVLRRVRSEAVSTESLDRVFAAAHDSAARHRGHIDLLRPDFIMMSFGAHEVSPMHTLDGCRCAVDLWRCLAPAECAECSILVDTEEFYVGTVGIARGKRSRVVFGFMPLLVTCVSLSHTRPAVYATQEVATHLPPQCCVSVECVRLEIFSTEVVVCELKDIVGDSGSEAVQQANIDLARSGFHFMRRGLYESALRQYSRITPTDSTIEYLKATCRARAAAGVTHPHRVVAPNPRMPILTRLIHGNLGPFLRTLLGELNYLLGGPACGTLSHAKANARTSDFSATAHSTGVTGASAAAAAGAGAGASSSPSGCSAPATPGSPWCAEAGEGQQATATEDDSLESSGLIEWIQPAEEDDYLALHVMPPQPESGPAETLPLLLRDANGNLWFRALHPFASGNFSIVYGGMSPEGERVVIKCIPLRRRNIRRSDLHYEMTTMPRLNHPNIVRYVSYCVTEAHLFLVVEFVSGGSLDLALRHFGPLPLTVVRRVTLDVLRGLRYLHANGIVHCDVKPHNMLLSVRGGVCKLSDFGSTINESRELSVSSSPAVRGSVGYLAPEIAEGGRSTPASDVFSLGVSILHMLCDALPWRRAPTTDGGGDTPQHTTDVTRLYNNPSRFAAAIARRELYVHVPETLDKDVQKFLRACCHEDPRRRPSAEELLTYPFML